MKSFLSIFSILLVALLSVSFSHSTGITFRTDVIDDVAPSYFRQSDNTNLHKYYVSVSNATYNESAKSVQMVTRFFMDDLEDVLNARLDKPVVLGDTSTIKELYPVLKNYFAKKLSVEINGSDAFPTFLGAEYESDQVVCYIEIPSNDIPREITMKFNAFIELFEEQKNLVHLKIDGERRTLLMDKNKAKDTVKF